MLKTKRPIKGSTVLFSVLLVTGCAESRSPLLDFLEESDFDNPVVNLPDVYGGEWTDFALICPNTPGDYISSTLGLPVEQVPSLEDSEQSGIIFWSDDSVAADLLNPSDVVLCDSTTPLASSFTAPTLSFSKGINGEWLANNPPVSAKVGSK